MNFYDGWINFVKEFSSHIISGVCYRKNWLAQDLRWSSKRAFVQEHQCLNILHRRLIEHSHSTNIHVHIGTPPSNETYPYWMHVTGDIRSATLKVGDAVVYDKGYLKALDNQLVLDLDRKYPD